MSRRVIVHAVVLRRALHAFSMHLVRLLLARDYRTLETKQNELVKSNRPGDKKRSLGYELVACLVVETEELETNTHAHAKQGFPALVLQNVVFCCF